jgi:hypothetical protein
MSGMGHSPVGGRSCRRERVDELGIFGVDARDSRHAGGKASLENFVHCELLDGEKLVYASQLAGCSGERGVPSRF